MVERTQTGGWMPPLYEPIRKVSQPIGSSHATVVAEFSIDAT